MMSDLQRKFLAIILFARMIDDWKYNEQHHQGWNKEERHVAFHSIRGITGRYVNIRRATNEEIADLFRDAVLRLLNGDVDFGEEAV